MGELFQAGCLALVEAAGRYDPDRHGEFPAYVLPRIRRAIHAALLTDRHPIRVPYGAACRGRRAADVVSAEARFSLAGTASPDLADSLDQRIRPDDESIRHALHRRFELAARQAAEALARRRRRRPDAPAILARITTERVLVGDPRQRTPVRRLAAELGISSGQVSAYEQQILRAAHEQLHEDGPARLLVRFARHDPAGFDGPVHALRRRQLRQAEVRQFERRFARLDAAEQARTLYGLVKSSSAGVHEVARNLFLLVRADS